MYVISLKKLLISLFIIGTILIIIASFVIGYSGLYTWSNNEQSNLLENEQSSKDYIKWVDFNITYQALQKAMNLDIKSHNLDSKTKYNWIEILAYLGNKYGGNFSRYKAKDMDNLVKRLDNGETIAELTKNMKYYNYYFEAYSAVLCEFVGNYSIEIPDKDGNVVWKDKYGLKAFSPIAAGYYYNDYDDFGTGRDYGFNRKHLGHDFMGNIGTPIIAVESGIIEEMGWNQYGGWRIGIRSFDKKRYYYYAHLRKDYPYVKTLEKGDSVKAGDVIGYLGRTGYSIKENVNNINTNHLHLGLQLIFDESQKECLSEIWIDLYDISKLLSKNRSQVQKIEGSKEYKRVYDISIAY